MADTPPRAAITASLLFPTAVQSIPSSPEFILSAEMSELVVGVIDRCPCVVVEPCPIAGACPTVLVIGNWPFSVPMLQLVLQLHAGSVVEGVVRTGLEVVMSLGEGIAVVRVGQVEQLGTSRLLPRAVEIRCLLALCMCEDTYYILLQHLLLEFHESQEE